jgi:nicotinamide-nucleotide amidase
MKQAPSNPQPRQLIAEVVSIGDEMTSGARLDTNAQWLSRRLGELGVTVSFHSTVGDTLQHNIDVFRVASERADIVVATGGLGPTRDDLTRESLAAVVNRPLELRESALAHIESLFARRKREMSERNRVQAMFPAGSNEIFNPQGTAPGIDLQTDRPGHPGSRIYALPGVPAEMKRMFDDSVAPRILAQSSAETRIRHLVMKFFGTGESDMERRLGEMISRDRQPRVGITVSTATISLRITATADTDVACEAMIASTKAEILSLVPEFYFGDGEEFEQHHAIEAMLMQRNESMMAIELGYAAPLGEWFASLGETTAYRGGLSLATTGDLMGMFDASSEAEAIQNVRQIFAVDWVLMVDRYPSLDKSSATPQPASEVRFIVGSPAGKLLATKTEMGGHPEVLQPRIAKAAMAWLRKILARA